MPKRLTIEERLIRTAQELGNHKTKRAAVLAALQEYVDHRKRLGILELFGTIDFDPAFDYKKFRRGR
jgi:hypothetical protein